MCFYAFQPHAGGRADLLHKAVISKEDGKEAQAATCRPGRERGCSTSRILKRDTKTLDGMLVCNLLHVHSLCMNCLGHA